MNPVAGLTWSVWGRLSQAQVSHVASVAQQNAEERGTAFQQRDQENDATVQALNQLDEERRWRERAQQQVQHAATLAHEYNYEEQEQSRRYRE